MDTVLLPVLPGHQNVDRFSNLWKMCRVKSLSLLGKSMPVDNFIANLKCSLLSTWYLDSRNSFHCLVGPELWRKLLWSLISVDYPHVKEGVYQLNWTEPCSDQWLGSQYYWLTVAAHTASSTNLVTACVAFVVITILLLLHVTLSIRNCHQVWKRKPISCCYLE